MQPENILLKKSEIAIEDILRAVTYQSMIEEPSNQKYPSFFDNQKSINGWYREGLNTVINCIKHNQVNVLGKLLSNRKGDYASIKSINKLILEHQSRLDDEYGTVDAHFAHMREIHNFLVSNNNELVKRIVNTRNNLTAHSFNEQKFIDGGGGTNSNETNEVLHELIKWAIRLSMLLMSSGMDSKWNHESISRYILKTIPRISDRTFQHFFSYNEGREGDTWENTVMIELIQLD